MGTHAALSDDRLVTEIDSAAAGIRAELERLTDDSVGQPSELPGWTRGHVLAHIQGICTAMARQVEYARRGEKVELYEGGYEARNRAIEDGAVATADQHRDRVGAALDRALGQLAAIEPGDWDRPITYRNGVVRDGGYALWRELVIHHSDLGTGCTQQEWSEDFCRHVLGFLEPRVPAANTFVLRSDRGGQIRLGSGGDEVLVDGRLQDLAAWLAGRPTGHGAVRAERGGEAVPLPEIGPWPSAGVPAA
ncbi:maleylpyruvate isomerase family mycothiol-dependent enzyme [Sinomonas albida]|uniref:maleylpyruvate isomerase family mycothiol-dependent enzyme n=1 Tax=Sinomonas albida TaxID=369942 RepID=UPI0010A84337|nr:maleylpyruvate isomerase family mycothiol-dependent enzyme [Sinomonas albida]